MAKINGDEYFGISSKFNFRDMDVITVGPIAQEVSRTFDIYTNQGSTLTFVCNHLN